MKLPYSSFRFICHFILQQRFKFAFLIAASMIWAINDTIFPYFLKRLINILQHFHGNPLTIFAAVKGTVFLLVLFWVLSEIMLRLQGITHVYTFPYFRASIRKAVFDYVKSHSHEYFSNHFAGNIAKKLADLPTSCQTITEIICFQYVVASVGSLIVLVMMWLTKPLFAVILLVWLCMHLGITLLFLRYGNVLWETHADAVSTLSGKIVDVFTNIATVRSFAHGQYEMKYLKKFQYDEIKKSKKATLVMELTRIGLGLNGLFLIFAMIGTLLYGWAHQWVTLGDFTQISMQSFWLLGWIWFASFQMTVYAREMGTVNNALGLIRRSHDLVDANNAYPISIDKGIIRFKDVGFSYSEASKVFNNLNLLIPSGQKVGLVGFSGSGKSTFVNLISRFYDLQQGQIQIDFQDIAQVTQDSLRSQIAMIPQDPSLFHRSIMENIRYGRLTATDEEVIEASKLAHCHEFIEKLPETYQSLVGERGVKLSGGQRQRIAIARAILKNAPILILDEATSSLDSVTEKLIQHSLHMLMQQRTTIVVAHRLATLADMDRILVFHKGQIIEEGTKESLLAANGHFAMLWKMQTDGFLPEIE